MHRTTPGLRAGAGARLEQLERQTPEWRGWLRLLAVVQRALTDSEWDVDLEDGSAPQMTVGGSRHGTPLLAGVILRVDGARVSRLLHSLGRTAAGEKLAGAAALADFGPGADQALSLLTAILRRDQVTLASVAAERGIPPGALTAMSELALLPILHAAERRLRGRIPGPWSHGHCPVCGAWPILAERRGVDRSRALRCGRCGAGWPGTWLRCVFCGEQDHHRLGSLVVEEARDTRQAETCDRCGGYLKSIATLQAVSPFELLLRDLETLELDLTALARGFTRPDGNAVPLDAGVAPR